MSSVGKSKRQFKFELKLKFNKYNSNIYTNCKVKLLSNAKFETSDNISLINTL